MASGKNLAECKREAQSQTTYVRYLSLKGELLTELPRAARAINSCVKKSKGSIATFSASSFGLKMCEYIHSVIMLK